MPIVGTIIRPPAEAGSFLLQVTTGCSSDRCGFCGAYKGKPFRVKPAGEIMADIERGARKYPGARRVFLMDGDALAVNNAKLIPILKKIGEAFPELSRVSSYANGYNITSRGDEELKELRDHRLSLMYMGLESGSQLVLDRCSKASGAEEMINAVSKAADAGIKSSVIVLLGLGGREHSKEHVAGTIKALNRMQPRYLSFLSLMLIPGTPLYEEAERGGFEELSPRELLEEARGIISGLELEKTIFRSDHASNHLSLEGRFPKDKELLTTLLQTAISGNIPLKPEFFRGL